MVHTFMLGFAARAADEVASALASASEAVSAEASSDVAEASSDVDVARIDGMLVLEDADEHAPACEHEDQSDVRGRYQSRQASTVSAAALEIADRILAAASDPSSQP